LKSEPDLQSPQRNNYIHSSLPSRTVLSVSELDTKEREENKMEREGEKEKLC